MRALTFGLILTFLLAGCGSSSKRLTPRQEQVLKMELVEENAKELTASQRYVFMATRFGTEDLLRERLQRMLEATRTQDRAAVRGGATLGQIHGVDTGARTKRIPVEGQTPPD